jgi:uncharacterized iron-regulated membrane protein
MPHFCTIASHSDRRPARSPRGAVWLAGFLIATALAAGAPRVAWGKGKHHGKKSAAEADAAPDPATPAEPAPEAAPEAAAATPTAPPALPPPAAPMVDPSGRLLYGPPVPGMGSVTIRGDKMQVSFDGRALGGTPVTIYNVPKGDYIVEGTAADGTQVNRPVSVDENGQAMVDLGTGATGGLSPAAAARLADQRSGRFVLASKVLLGVGGAALGVGLAFGILEWKAHRDYEGAPADQATLDALARTGHRDATVANIGFITCGASLLAAGLVALPSVLKRERSTSDAESITVTAIATPGAAMAGAAFRF